MKKLSLFLLFFCASFCCIAQNMNQPPLAVPIMLQVHWDDPQTGNNNPKTPSLIPELYYSNHALYFGEELHAAFILTFLDEDGVVWQTSVEATATSVVLPNNLSGDYQLRLACSDDYYYYADIYL